MKPPVLILCGGRGTRLQEHTQLLPKPLVEIGGRPIVWHVIQIYLAQGFTRFLLLTGYRREKIAEFVAGQAWPAEVEIRCLATGEDTPTGGRVHRAAEVLDGEACCLTYADGVADVDLEALLDYHRDHGAAATCFSSEALATLGPDSVLECEPLERLARAGQLRAFRHEGFWACMDTYKDAVELGDLWAQGSAPWKLWK